MNSKTKDFINRCSEYHYQLIIANELQKKKTQKKITINEECLLKELNISIKHIEHEFNIIKKQIGEKESLILYQYYVEGKTLNQLVDKKQNNKIEIDYSVPTLSRRINGWMKKYESLCSI